MISSNSNHNTFIITISHNNGFPFQFGVVLAKHNLVTIGFTHSLFRGNLSAIKVVKLMFNLLGQFCVEIFHYLDS